MSVRFIRRAALGEGAAAATHPAALLVTAVALAAVVGLASPTPAQKPPADDGDDPRLNVYERLTVTDSRLRDRPAEDERVPAHVTVLGREDIAAARAVSPQELLAREAGVVVFDSTGSDLQKTVDLRGFTGGGVKVYLDGAPLNDPRNNSLSLELVSPETLERIEINRGSGSGLAGGGSEAGVINLWTRRGGSGGRFAIAAGSDDRRGGGIAGGARGAAGDWFAALSSHETEGHRENGGASLRRLSAAIGRSLGGGDLRLSLIAGEGEFGNPGALRPEEIAADRRQAPFNRLDFSDERLLQPTVNYELPLGASASLRANLFARDRDHQILTTGRAAPVFGGFFLDSATALAGSAVQLSRYGGAHEIVAGLDWLEADTDALGVPTPASDPGRIDRSAPSSDNVTTRRTAALYLQHRWLPSERLSLTLGGRWDDDEVGYREILPDPSNRARRTYSELSLRGGVTLALDARSSLYAAYGEAFLPPTVEELFSFPLFGSNPDLEPEDSRSLELGARRVGARHEARATVFRIDTRDEIVFDPASPLAPFGANVNAGETRREGLELVLRGRPRDGLRWFATATRTDAEFVGGANRGRTVPLVPDDRLSVGIEIELSAAVDLSADILRVGKQVLDNDDANLQPPLDPYTVLNARLGWDLRRDSRGGAAPRVFVIATNLFDQSYSTRGIFAFDFSTFSESIFFTPAPGRRISVGIEWLF